MRTAIAPQACMPRSSSAPGFAALLCLLLCCLGGSAWAQTANQAQGKRVALLIGNANYRFEKQLRNPVNDATLLGQVLERDLKFDRVRVAHNLDLDAMDRVLDQFVREAAGAGTVVFYFSGHGLSPERRSYLLPVDAQTGTPGARALKFQALQAEDIKRRLQSIGARTTLMLLDACRDGPGGDKSGSKGLAPVGGGQGFLVAYATEEGKVAADGEGRNSPYAEALAEAWRQRELSVLAQLDLVADKVMQRVPGQVPTREGNLRVDTFLANPFGAVTPANRDRIEDEAWALCRGGASRVPCDDYLSGWPQGRYVGLARTRINDLVQAERASAAAGAQATRAVPAAPLAQSRTPERAGQVIKDCAECPELVVIPAGSFLMGSPNTEPGRDVDEGPQRQVTISRPFALGKYEVTQGQWRALMDTNPSHFKDCGDDCPVERVSWNEVQEYIRRLNAKTGHQYRLPSEAEWEYAARAGTLTPFHTGQTITTDQANFDGRAGYNGDPRGVYRATTVKVGSFAGNAWGLHDMHGNVREWTQDCYGAYSLALIDGGAKEQASCEQRVARGGGWIDDPRWVRSPVRYRGAPAFRDFIFGFRLARPVLQ